MVAPAIGVVLGTSTSGIAEHEKARGASRAHRRMAGRHRLSPVGNRLAVGLCRAGARRHGTGLHDCHRLLGQRQGVRFRPTPDRGRTLRCRRRRWRRYAGRHDGGGLLVARSHVARPVQSVQPQPRRHQHRRRRRCLPAGPRRNGREPAGQRRMLGRLPHQRARTGRQGRAIRPCDWRSTTPACVPTRWPTSTCTAPARRSTIRWKPRRLPRCSAPPRRAARPRR